MVIPFHSSTATAVACVVASGLLLGTLGVFVTEAGTGPVETAWFRCLFGALALGAWARVGPRPTTLHLRRSQAPRVLAAGALVVASWVLFFAAIPRTSVAEATLLVHVQPLWMLLLSVAWLREPVARRRVAAVALAMGGLALATLSSAQPATAQGTVGSVAGYALGAALCLLCALFTALATLLAGRASTTPRRVEGEHRPAQHAEGAAVSVPALSIAWWQCVVGAVLLAPWALADGVSAPASAWGWLVGLGVLHTALAYALLYRGVAGLRADRVAALQFVYPLTAIAVDALVYDHRLGASALAGVALMLAGLWAGAPGSPGRRSR